MLPRALPRELVYACLRPTSRPCRLFSGSCRRYDGQKPFYVSTPIYYVNAAPHIGHLYSSVIADVIARWSRVREPERPVIFATGTDEFGLKIQTAAAKASREPQGFCDDVSQNFRNLADTANISYTRFIRTTERVHQDTVQQVWRELRNRDQIYLGNHVGWYSVADECFYTESQITMVDGKPIAVETGRPVEWTHEENYMFRLSAFQQPLLDWLTANPDGLFLVFHQLTELHPELFAGVVPSKRYKEVLDFIKDPGNLKDLSVSRPRLRLTWGVPVPDDPGHTVYVWLDALVNYLTVIGYPWNGDNAAGLSHGWPADVQVVGKDIVKFHAVYWPAFLMALGLDPPKQVLAHAHWTMDRRKMSKTDGNVVDPHEAMSRYGVDTVRMYLCTAGGNLTDDADWNDLRLRAFYDGVLRNNVGNLLSRVTSKTIMARAASEPFDYSPDKNVHEQDAALHALLSAVSSTVEDYMQKKEFGHAANAILQCVTEANIYFTTLKPWLPQQPDLLTARAQFYGYEALRIAGILLQPFMPSKAARLLDALGVKRRELSAAVVGAEGRGAQLRAKGGGVLFPPLVEVAKSGNI